MTNLAISFEYTCEFRFAHDFTSLQRNSVINARTRGRHTRGTFGPREIYLFLKKKYFDISV